MKKYDIAHSELTNCYYIMCDGKKVYDCTEQIANIRAKEKLEMVCDFNDGIQQGMAAMQAFVEKRCEELGIDYTLIFTCEGAD